MAKELPYFKFEPSQWENGNIQMCSFEAQGIFMNVCSMYWQRLGDLPYKLAVQKICKGNATAFESLVEDQIIKVVDGMICIDFLNEQLAEFNNISKTNSDNARLGWQKRIKEATVMRPHSEPNAIREEERRVDKIRGEKKISGGKQKINFLLEVKNVGGDIYTDEMLKGFSDYWTEPIVKGKDLGKERWQGEKTWKLTQRLSKWAERNLDGIVCYREDDKSIKDKKIAFKNALRPFLEVYPKDMINAFLLHWSQPENIKHPKKLKWELEDSWELKTRLTSWKAREDARQDPIKKDEKYRITPNSYQNG